MPGLSVTLTTAGGDLLVFFYAMVSVNATGIQSRYYFSLDGVETLIGLPHSPNTDYQFPIVGLTRYTGSARPVTPSRCAGRWSRTR